MKRYTLTIVIDEGSDEFWEAATKDGASGCDDVRNEVISCLAEHGFDHGQDCLVTLTKYEDMA